MQLQSGDLAKIVISGFLFLFLVFVITQIYIYHARAAAARANYQAAFGRLDTAQKDNDGLKADLGEVRDTILRDYISAANLAQSHAPAATETRRPALARRGVRYNT